jgi:hypothetical protein
MKKRIMSGAELLCLNLTETRRRSIRIWRGIPMSMSDWRPDLDAMSYFEMVRHVLEADYLYGQMIRERRSYSGGSPFADRHFDDLGAALVFATPYRESLLETVLQLSDDDLNTARLVTSSCESHITSQFTPDRYCNISAWLVFHGHQFGISAP